MDQTDKSSASKQKWWKRKKQAANEKQLKAIENSNMRWKSEMKNTIQYLVNMTTLFSVFLVQDYWLLLDSTEDNIGLHNEAFLYSVVCVQIQKPHSQLQHNNCHLFAEKHSTSVS